MENKSARAKVQAFGGFLTAMVIPNIGAFIAWGFITALFIPTGWLPNEHFAKIVGPMITYLLPVMIGSTGGHLVGGKRGAVMGGIGTTLVSFAITSLILKMEKTVETESEDEFAQSANAVKAMKQEGAFSLSRVKRIAFVCDAGMGSSAMGATTFRKRLEKAGLAIEVKHYAIENVPADADIVVTHASLEGRVKRVTDKPLILINNYIGDPKLDTLFNQLTAEHKH
ncbi:TPA: PTS lactose/cellobiose specific IIB subunit [Escherichia coli]|uniref:PTS lactose/cellobiose specific IIB subunit n=1 Tax=Escherichia coli TaxID=562 RepID=UPI000925B426|nr:PTS lactose/cellobiose specific IIB subunit [Escherichia coli]MCA8598472.1 PTS lactose/cellobiose specific IIB subunit [Escherichia coli]OJR09762.1 hypothetical protein BK374_06915 [Escherichia coli]RLX49638.1 PTS lactose/cellobiose specific IIB subunit [Escherichia coli]HCJ9570389.1 PTS lactose/cellobiose specific IIB subunit [Escherichia coli]HDS0610197.1 PTS lactose/cellobiose specific IIB subunit [Escherichia coli]